MIKMNYLELIKSNSLPVNTIAILNTMIDKIKTKNTNSLLSSKFKSDKEILALFYFLLNHIEYVAITNDNIFNKMIILENTIYKYLTE